MNETDKKIFCDKLNMMLKGNTYYTLEKLKELYREEKDIITYLKKYE